PARIPYPRAVVLVTHDRALIDSVATRTWAIEPGPASDGAGEAAAAAQHVREVLGGYSDLLLIRERERRDAERAGGALSRASRRPAGPLAGASPRGADALERQIREVES